MVHVGEPGGRVAAFDETAAALLDELGDALGLAVEPAFAAEVEDLGPPAEDGGDDPGLTGDPAGEGGGDLFAGVELGCLQPADQGLVVHEDHDGGVEAPDLGSLLGRVALDELGDSACPIRSAVGLPFAERAGGGAVLGGGEREERLLEHGAVEGGEGEPAMDLAVPVGDHGQPGGSHRLRVPRAPTPVAWWASAASGSIISRSRWPMRLRSRASKWAASVISWVSASVDQGRVEVFGEVGRGRG